MQIDQEQKLIELAKTDGQAFGELYDLYYLKIFNYILRRTSDFELSQDITADVFMKALDMIHKFTWRGLPFSAWLYRIASNEIADHFRGKQTRTVSLEVLTDALATMQKYKAKLQGYETTVLELLNIHAAGLKGVKYEVVLAAAKRFFKQSDKFFDYVAPTIVALKKSHDIAIVTGEPQFVAEAVRELFGAGSYYSSQYEVIKGVFTGKVASYLALRHEKHQAIGHLMQKHGAGHSFAFGDSEGDIEMLAAVEHPVCLNATDGLRAIAQERGWHTPGINEVARLVVRLNANRHK